MSQNRIETDHDRNRLASLVTTLAFLELYANGLESATSSNYSIRATWGDYGQELGLAIKSPKGRRIAFWVVSERLPALYSSLEALPPSGLDFELALRAAVRDGIPSLAEPS